MRERPAGLWAGLREAFRYAASGLHYAVRTQRTFRIQLLCAALIALLTFWLRPGPLGTALVALALFGVLASELMNTGVEAIVDLLVERNHHELARRAKDIAAAAVVTAVVGAVIAGALVLGPPLAARLGVSPRGAQILAWGGVLLVVAAGTGAVLGLLRRPVPDEDGGPGRRTS
ncbi:MAG: diacylglycerol kinase [Armatimonadota bacterium]|nr:diacylglycerol kinase [Armatimonadota bacterium]MDR7451258.1 diacylglycerol kinase [Armatimonadota bacterium]MDR7466839.1 diacylglycerol kinase [Armatimonadota bacterium]MDR7492688.1 diacylglycerol kinase [Armatimonadota bacterium]MDR7499617.1 diacylglycerol kinase [Armatimonadota bacterium]